MLYVRVSQLGVPSIDTGLPPRSKMDKRSVGYNRDERNESESSRVLSEDTRPNSVENRCETVRLRRVKRSRLFFVISRISMYVFTR